MPIYEYRRVDGSTFDVLQSITDDPLTEDPDTGQPVERVLHAPAVHFKGSGFYNTDYGTRRRNREKEAAGAEGGGDKKPDKGEAKKADAASSSSSSSGSGAKATSTD